MSLPPPLPDDWYSLLLLTMMVNDIESIKIDGENYREWQKTMEEAPQFVIVHRERNSMEILLVTAKQLYDAAKVPDGTATGLIG